MRFAFWVIGCQMNVADSERIARVLTDQGHVHVPDTASADLVVLMSCSVRQTAEDRLWGHLREVAQLKRARTSLVVAASGCVSDGDVEGFLQRAPVVDVYVDPRRPESLLEWLADHGLADTPDFGDLDLGALVPRQGLDHTAVALHGVSRHVPAIYGCDYRCTYCIVPYTRGPQVSRPVDEISREVEWLVQGEGAREVTVLGQTVDAYGEDLPGQPRLSNLLTRLDRFEGLDRVRFLTSHPNHMTLDLIDAVRDLPHVCEHINLPFQAGDNDVLRRMARRYRSEDYRSLIGTIRDRVPDVSLSTDVIVGFPGESEEQFECTLDMLRDIEFDVVHVAMYSPRKGTPAPEVWPDDVPRAEKKRRRRAVENVQQEIALRRNRALVGETAEVLVEGPSQRRSDQRAATQRWGGRTRANRLVFFTHDGNPTGELAPVQITQASPWYLEGVSASTSAASA
ncbi:MAG: tRNA (N6-isopentenyl adenosine(37)-C2)-methylthiotransferase MiaB [Dehalococcoidia bacterium]|nr:tRNA (N6-isopentenyl adenosine(37)-C2)-methylthiotransferase MiaB [Dehalococcoidia bacterium]